MTPQLVGETIKSINSPRDWYMVIEFESGKKIEIQSGIGTAEYPGFATRSSYLSIKEVGNT